MIPNSIFSNKLINATHSKHKFIQNQISSNKFLKTFKTNYQKHYD